ncbi:cytochrome b5 type B-like [Cloeon dipterum]|uniref:cytochrome b5 type B-like n=1 Tax=Cloeon dipterum TaxID=197152 RepID=UPI00322085BB
MTEIREIELAEVRQHNTEESLWIVIRGEVFDVTKFVKEHPGGGDQLLGVAGKDATKDFNNVGHSKDARDMLTQFKIGVLTSKDNLETSNSSPSKEKEKAKSCCIIQ